MLYSRVLEVLATVQFTPEIIAGIVGVILMMIFAYFPKLNTAYAGLATEVKSWIMLGVLLLAEVIICLLSFYGVIATEPTFSWGTALKVAFALIASNQPAYRLLPKTKEVSEIIIKRDAVAEEKVLEE